MDHQTCEDIQELEKALASLQNIQIDVEIQAHKDHKEWDQKRKDINELSSQISRVKLDISREEKLVAKLAKEIETLANHECHTCGQPFHDSKHQQVMEAKQTDLATHRESCATYSTLLSELQTAHNGLGTLGKPPKMFYDKSLMQCIIRQL
jgi:DNA repair exonuclease SbcCD ATPase subunit